jgi:phosphatidylserine/phosphatidylglycerophosphate/cardiolipin synthase-like enzyme
VHSPLAAFQSRPHHRAAAWLLLGLVLCPAVAHGRDAAAFAAAIEAAVAPPAVYLAGTTPTSPLLTAGNVATAVPDGTAAVISTLVELIARSERELLLQIYEWDDDDESAQGVQRALEARLAAAPALRAHLIVDDSWPALHAPNRGRLEAFARAHADQVELAYHRGVGLGILHTKTVMADGREALLMTGNFRTAHGLAGDFYNTGLLVQGPVVQTMRDDWLSARAASTAVSGALRLADGETAAATEAPWHSLAGPWGPSAAAVLTRRANPDIRDRGDLNPQDRGLLAAIDTAEHHIAALNPALNARPILAALARAAVERGVQVHVVLSLNMDRTFQRFFAGGDNADTAHRLLAAVLAAGGPTAADRLHISWASSGTGAAAGPSDPGNVHAKIASFDGACLWVGSMNWDWQSWNNSRELSVALFDEAAAAAWERGPFATRRALAAHLRADDLPRLFRHTADPVYRYLRARGR